MFSCETAYVGIRRNLYVLLFCFRQTNLRYARSLARARERTYWSGSLPNKPLLQSPQTLIEGAHVLRHTRQP